MKFKKKCIPYILLLLIFFILTYLFCYAYMQPFGEDFPFGDFEDGELSFLKYGCLFLLQAGIAFSVKMLWSVGNKTSIFAGSITSWVCILLFRESIWLQQVDHDVFYLSLFQNYSVYVGLLHLCFGFLLVLLFSLQNTAIYQNACKTGKIKYAYLFGFICLLFFSYRTFSWLLIFKNSLPNFVCAFLLQTVATCCLIRLWPIDNSKAPIRASLISTICFIALGQVVWLENLDIQTFQFAQLLHSSVILIGIQSVFGILIALFFFMKRSKSYK